MKLYHYAKTRFPELLTKRLSGASAEEIRKSEKQRDKYGFIGAYVDHISFFFDPIPSKTLGDIFKNDHSTWYRGNTLYEYVIDLGQFESDLGYAVMESRNKTAFMDQFIAEHNWVDDDPVLLAKYLKELAVLEAKWGEVGHSLSKLKQQVALNVGKTQQAYLDAAARADFEEGRHRYATNVPHLMLYPRSGKAQYSELNQVTIGSDTRTPILRAKPASFKW
ncbi:hypothetical protein D3C76_89690 [compost metagenome]